MQKRTVVPNAGKDLLMTTITNEKMNKKRNEILDGDLYLKELYET